MIAKSLFGRTKHKSSRIIFGGYALSNVTQKEANDVLEVLLEYGINHIDTAPMYGKSEKLIGSWMTNHREDFFIATKTRSRSYKGAKKNLSDSLEALNVEYIDLWQMHGLTNPQGWEKAMGPGGTLEAFIEAREEGLVRFLGVTAHGGKSAIMHNQSLKRFDFDSVMLPYNFSQMQEIKYKESFQELINLCHQRNIAFQTIKSIARRPWESESKTHNTYFYQPLENKDAIEKAIHWALGLQNSFVITAGDITLLPIILEAAKQFSECPSDAEMQSLVDQFQIKNIFSY
ncbi:MAG TPA: aldo/keto reductase [candidate division Zixibacteria bacterium]|nr:aldo/keto reductase [candidate division Zixibacteria bacterium]